MDGLNNGDDDDVHDDDADDEQDEERFRVFFLQISVPQHPSLTSCLDMSYL